MSRKVAIIGMGHVGSTVAHYIVACGYADDLALFDKNEGKVNADALDFQDAMANLPYHTNITVNDWSQLKDTDIIISALGNIALLDTPHANRFIELKPNREAVKEVSAKIKDSGFNGIIIAITNPVDVITSLFQEYTGLPKKHVIGTGTLLDTARMQRAIGNLMHVDPRSVEGYTLGEHGNSQFSAWSTVKVLNQPVEKVAKEHNFNLEQINEDVKNGAWKVFAGKKYTSYGVATAGVRVMNAVFSDAHIELPVSNWCEQYGVYMSIPAIVGRDGIIEQAHLDLTDDELKKLQASANYIDEKVKDSLKN